MLSPHIIDIDRHARAIEQHEAHFIERATARGDVWLPEDVQASLGGVDPVTCSVQAVTGYRRELRGPTPLTGLLTVSPEALQAAEKLNAAKLGLKNAIAELRNALGLKRTTLDKLMDDDGELKRRDPALAEQFRRLEIGDWDLQRAYRLIPILPAGTESVSWVWQRSSPEIKPLYRHEVLALIEKKIEDDEQASALKDQVMRLSAAEEFASVRPKPAQLRANLVVATDGDYENRQIVAPTVLITSQSQRPFLTWPGIDLPAGRRKRRRDAKIETEPFIAALRIHRYLPGKSPSRKKVS